jgi:hypothetical protein
LQVLNIVQGTVFGALRLRTDFTCRFVFITGGANSGKKNKKSWDPKQMVAAVNAVRKKDMGLKKAAIPFSFPRSTLKDYVKKGEHDVEKRVLGNLGRKPVLSPELENEFVKLCLNMENKFFGLFHSNISERRARQGTAVLVTGSPHKQKVIEERGLKKARENTRTELGAEAKKRTQQRKMRLQQRRNLLQERVQNGNRNAEERRALFHPLLLQLKR